MMDKENDNEQTANKCNEYVTTNKMFSSSLGEKKFCFNTNVDYAEIVLNINNLAIDKWNSRSHDHLL